MSLLINSWMATREGTIEAIAGSDQIQRAQMVVLAALWDDELAPQFYTQVKARLFDNDLLRTIAAYSIGSLSTYGCNDLLTVRRLLRVKFPDQAVSVTIRTIERLVDLIDADDVKVAIKLLNGAPSLRLQSDPMRMAV